MLLLTSDNKLVTYDLGRHSVDRDLIKHLIARGQLDAANLKPLISVSPHKKAILDMVIPEGEETIVMTLSQDNTVKVTDLLTGNQLADIFLEDVPSCFCSVMATFYFRTSLAPLSSLGLSMERLGSTTTYRTLLI